MFRSPKFIVLAAIALYAIALVVTWQQVDARAELRIRTILEAAERGYSDVINGEIDAALRYVGGALVNVMDGKCSPQTKERVRELADTFNLDEINIVNRDGIVIGSNLDAVMGFDFRTNSLTREFMALVDGKTTLVTQPFRAGVANPEMFCKYYGLAFPDGSGFLQLGLTVARLRKTMYSYTDEEADEILKDWHFSVAGWYERAADDPGFEAGRTFRRRCAELGEKVIGRYFVYHGFRYVAFIPESYCYSQRNAAFAVTALALGVLLFLFTYFLVRLANASVKLERMHAAADARTAADMALARTIQMSALPSSDGAFAERLDFTLAAACRPAREVGGDFYDFFHVSDGRSAFLVADASGKGIPAALFMMEAKNVLKNCLSQFADLAEAVSEANRRLCAGNQAEMFITAWIGVMDDQGGFEYVNAGHNRPFVRRADGTVEKLTGKGGCFLGMFDQADYRAFGFRLAPGDALYLYTDGITEAMDAKREQFGERRLRAELASGNWRIKEAVDAFVAGAEQSDDMTDMVISWHGRARSVRRDFAADASSLAPALAFLREALAGLDARTVTAMLNAADEVTANIVGYSGAREYRIEVERGVDRLRIRFSDDGVAYNPLQHADPDTHAAIEDRPVGGLGLVVVKRLADRVTYAREDDRNVLALICRSRKVQS